MKRNTIESKDRGISEKKNYIKVERREEQRREDRTKGPPGLVVGLGVKVLRSRRYLPRGQPRFSELFSDVDLELDLATLLLLLNLQEQCTVDAGQDTTEGDSCADKGVQFFITTDGELEVARRDTLDLKILGGVTCQFENFSSEVLKNSGHVDGSYRRKSVSDGFGGSAEAE